MTESFVTIFDEPGKANSLGRSSEVVEAVLGDNQRLPELFECVFDEDAWIRMRAIDSVEKVCRVHPDWLEPYTERIFSDLSRSDQPSIQWHLAEMFTQIKLNESQQQFVLKWLAEKLASTDVDWIVAGDCMKALLYFYNRGQFDGRELMQLISIQQSHSSQAIRKKAKKLAEEISAKPAA